MRRELSIFRSILIFAFVLFVFLMAASFEYERVIANSKRNSQAEAAVIENQLENLIGSRMMAVQGITSFIEIQGQINQKEYEQFVKDIYLSVEDSIVNLALLTDTTITHVYPYDENKSAIGVDLAQIEGQKDLIEYVKENKRSGLAAPVNLVQGGTGIIARVPILTSDTYYGQLAIVLDYDDVMEAVGLVSLADDYAIELVGGLPMASGQQVIFSKGQFVKKDYISEEIQLFDTTWTLKIAPLGGWTGNSTLFYMIMIFGVLGAGFSSYGVWHDYQARLALSATNTQLAETIKKLNKSEVDNSFLANHDFLTNLQNRRVFIGEIKKRLLAKERGAIVLLDIDNFKDINDTMGHIYGDEVLKHLAHLFAGEFDHLVFRLGGDEFVFIIPGEVSENKLVDQLNYISHLVKDNNQVAEYRNYITLSMGISIYPDQGKDVEELLMKADVAMYQSKEKGKNQFQFFKESMIQDFEQKVTFEKQVRSYIENKQYQLYYQPIVDANTGQIAYAEALIRGQGVQFNPGEFIAAAERMGLILSVGREVIKLAVSQLAAWQKKGYAPCPVSINISPKEIYDRSIITYIDQVLGTYQVSPDLVEIEITENVLIENQQDNIKTLNQFKEMGLGISLDDFGTGFSSINYLTFLPMDKLKLDKTLKDRCVLGDNQDVLDGVITIAHGQDLKVVAEGVENKKEWDLLKSQDCDYIQGYYFSRPLSVEAFESQYLKKE